MSLRWLLRWVRAWFSDLWANFVWVFYGFLAGLLTIDRRAATTFVIITTAFVIITTAWVFDRLERRDRRRRQLELMRRALMRRARSGR